MCDRHLERFNWSDQQCQIAHASIMEPPSAVLISMLEAPAAHCCVICSTAVSAADSNGIWNVTSQPLPGSAGRSGDAEQIWFQVLMQYQRFSAILQVHTYGMFNIAIVAGCY
jgi:hypothetical protein